MLGGIINADDETISFINKLMDLNVMSGNFNKSTKCYTNLSINNMGKLLKVYNVGTDLSTMYSIKITEGRTTIYTLMYSISNACFQSVSSVVLVPEIKTYLINHYDRIIEEHKLLSQSNNNYETNEGKNKIIDSKILELKNQILTLKKQKSK